MKKIISLILTLLLATAVLASCGTKNPKSSSSGNALDTSASETTDPLLDKEGLGLANENYTFDSYYAKTPDDFFYIDSGKRLKSVNSAGEEKELSVNASEIAGVTSNWLFYTSVLGTGEDRKTDLLRIKLDGSSKETVENDIVPGAYFYSKNLTLYFGKGKDLPVLKGRYMPTGATADVYTSVKDSGGKSASGFQYFRSGSLFVGTKFQGSGTQWIELDETGKLAQSGDIKDPLSVRYIDPEHKICIVDAEKKIFTADESGGRTELLKSVLDGVLYKGSIYYVETKSSGKDFVKVTTGGTDKTVLRSGTSLIQLYVRRSGEEALFGLALYNGGKYTVHSLGDDGKPVASLISVTIGSSGKPSSLKMAAADDKIFLLGDSGEGMTCYAVFDIKSNKVLYKDSNIK